ncbi:MAG: peptidase dimerization domain protein, partial [Bacteroidota bacterium]
MESIKAYISSHKDRFISELVELLKLPSISADSQYKTSVLDTTQAVMQRLTEAGCDHVEICETPGYPIVYAQKIIDPSLPTVLVYGHYDVQPPDPMDLWDSPPFEPVIKATEKHPDGAIFARGAC